MLLQCFLQESLATIAMAMSRNDDDGHSVFSSGLYFVITLVLDIIFSILGSMVVAYFLTKKLKRQQVEQNFQEELI